GFDDFVARAHAYRPQGQLHGNRAAGRCDDMRHIVVRRQLRLELRDETAVVLPPGAASVRFLQGLPHTGFGDWPGRRLMRTSRLSAQDHRHVIWGAHGPGSGGGTGISVSASLTSASAAAISSTQVFRLAAAIWKFVWSEMRLYSETKNS